MHFNLILILIFNIKSLFQIELSVFSQDLDIIKFFLDELKFMIDECEIKMKNESNKN